MRKRSDSRERHRVLVDMTVNQMRWQTVTKDARATQVSR